MSGCIECVEPQARAGGDAAGEPGGPGPQASAHTRGAVGGRSERALCRDRQRQLARRCWRESPTAGPGFSWSSRSARRSAGTWSPWRPRARSTSTPRCCRSIAGPPRSIGRSFAAKRHTGISIITLAEKIDAGDILAQSRTAIGPLETAGELHDRLARLAAPLLLDTLDKIESGTAAYIKQDPAQVTFAPKLRKATACWISPSPPSRWPARSGASGPGRGPLRASSLSRRRRQRAS